jgi:hypothetical protein
MCLCLGCGGGGDDVERYDVSGAVTVGGQPVTTGQIVFQPDASAGNSGAPGTATIVDGKFDTSQGGKGTIGGAIIARIEGRIPAAAGGADTVVSAEEKLTLPKETTTHDFNLPAEAGKAAPTSTEPPP